MTALLTSRRVFSIVALSLVACGGGQQASKAPSKEDAPPRTVEEAQDQIDATRAQIEQIFAEAPPPSVSADKADGGTPVFDAATCGRQCKALASMKRAVDVVCKLTSDTENRCQNARRILDVSTRRVASAGCTCPS